MVGTIAYCKIHPAIGIARVGNSPTELFIGPEFPGIPPTPIGGFKDEGDADKGVPSRVKRQAAQFRIIGYDASNNVVRELTCADADIKWTAHLVNSKAAGFRLDGTARNDGIRDRGSLVINPGPREIEGALKSVVLDGGKFRDVDVCLGELRTDNGGRLLILGGAGRAESSNPRQQLTSPIDNDLWFDDTCDGMVSATVTQKSGATLKVSPSWVVVAPPDFAPAVENIVTAYDVALDVAVMKYPGQVSAPGSSPSFRTDVAPIFRRLAGMDWVQEKGRASGNRGGLFRKLEDLENADDEKRAEIFELFREPVAARVPDPHCDSSLIPLPALPMAPGTDRFLPLTQVQFETLRRWKDGTFTKDLRTCAVPGPTGEPTPEGLDRAGLESCCGGPFEPGFEVGRVLKDPDKYLEPFRLDPAKCQPGDVTQSLPCPWQAGLVESKQQVWPSQAPEEVITEAAYRRLRGLEEQLAQPLVPAERQRVEAEYKHLFPERARWSRGIPPDGHLAMVEKWPQHGFIVGIDQRKEPFELAGMAIAVETERGKYDGLSMADYFILLNNIDRHPDFLPKAKELAHGFFEKADYDADPNYGFFAYSAEALDRRLKKIYDEMVMGMHEPSRMDSGRITWPVVVRREGDKQVTRELTFNVGRFSDRVVRERLRQRAPFNLVDGAWLQNIQSAGPSDAARAHLFQIWNDESGNGVVSQNHANVYEALLRSLNIYLPPITSPKFLEVDLLAEAFVQPVLQLSISMFPTDFFPELLGMTLYQEWEATPAMTPGVRLHEDRGIDPHFYSLHVAIDNISAGHGYLAKEAIKLFLQQNGTDAPALWKRIWCGYVTWATAGGLGEELLKLCLIMDHKQFDISYPIMLRPKDVVDAPALLAQLADAARGTSQVAFTIDLVDRFTPEVEKRLRAYAGQPHESLALIGPVVDELNRMIQDADHGLSHAERLAHHTLKPDTIDLIDPTLSGEDVIKLNRLILRDVYAAQIADIPDRDDVKPQLFPDYRAHFKQKFVELIKKKAPTAKPMHTGVKVGGQPLARLFDVPDKLIEALGHSTLIDKDRPRDSRFFEATRFNGKMYNVFTGSEIDVILDWIESLRPPVPPPPVPPGPSAEEAAERMLKFLEDYARPASQERAHTHICIKGKTLMEWLATPLDLMEAFRTSPEWVVPGDSSSSRLFIEFVSGPMRFMPRRVKDVVSQWIDSGAELPASSASPLTHATGVHAPATAARDAIGPPAPGRRPRPAAPPGKRSSPQATAVDGVLDPRFAARRKLIGMGSVH